VYGVEYEIENSAGTQVGRIVDPARLAAETPGGESESKWSHLKTSRTSPANTFSSSAATRTSTSD